MKSLLTTLVFLLLSISAFSSNPSDSLKAQAIFDEGQSLYEVREFEAAIKKFKKASTLFRANKNYNSYLKSKLMIAGNYSSLYINEKAINTCNEVISESKILFKQPNEYVAEAYRYIAQNKFWIVPPDTALFYSTLGLNILKRNMGEYSLKYLDDCYNIRGNIYIRKNMYDSAKYYIEESSNLRKKIYGGNSLEMAKTANTLGMIYYGLGENYLAIEHYHKASNIRNSLNINIPSSIFSTNLNIANAHFELRNYKRALNYNRNCLLTLNSIITQDIQKKASIFNNLGNTMIFLNKYDSAIYYIGRSLDILIKNHKHEAIGQGYNNLGIAYEEKKQYSKAFKLYKKSLDIYLRLLGNESLAATRGYYNLAKNSNKQLHHQLAISFANESIRSNIIIQKKDRSLSNTAIINNFRNYDLLLDVFFIKSSSQEKIYNSNQQKEYLVESNSTYNLGCQIIDSLKSTFTTSADKIELLNVSKNIFEGAIRTNLMLSKLNKKRTHSLQVVQNYKSTLLSDNSEVNESLSDSLKTEIRNVRKNFSNLRSQILKEEAKSTKDSTYLFESKVALFDLKRKKEYIENNAQQNKNASSISRYTPAQQVMDSLDTNTMVLEYFVGDSSIYLFAMSKNDYIIKEIAKPITFTEDIESLNESMKNPASFAEKSWDLYQKLIAPGNIGESIKNIIIIPDGILWKLNFETLLTSGSENIKFGNMPFLLKKYSISYASTSNFNKQSKKKKTNNHKMLAFSYNEQDDNDFGGLLSLNNFRSTNKKLPGSSREIKEISNIIDGDYHYGNEANESMFKALSGDYQIIHMALHGETNEGKPDESKLIFHARKDTLDDGLLFGFELANMELNADLVVLSACNTGAGKIENGVGIMSLGRSFSTAGVSSLLLSKWEVSDVTAPFILKYFYEGLKQGMRKSEALKFAKLRFLENDADNITASPYYWNSFYILGDDSPIVFESSNSYWKHLLIGLMILLVVGGFFWKRRIKKIA